MREGGGERSTVFVIIIIVILTTTMKVLPLCVYIYIHSVIYLLTPRVKIFIQVCVSTLRGIC